MKNVLLGIFVLVVATNAAPSNPFVEVTGERLNEFRVAFREALKGVILAMYNLTAPMVAELEQDAAQCKESIRMVSESCRACMETSCDGVPEDFFHVLSIGEQKRVIRLPGSVFSILNGKRSKTAPHERFVPLAFLSGASAAASLANTLYQNKDTIGAWIGWIGKRSETDPHERIAPLAVLSGASAAASLANTLYQNKATIGGWFGGKRSETDPHERIAPLAVLSGASAAASLANTLYQNKGRIGGWFKGFGKRSQGYSDSACFSQCPMCLPFTDDLNRVIDAACGSDILLKYTTMYRPLKMLAMLDDVNTDEAAPILQKIAYNPNADGSPILVWARFPSGIMEYESFVPFQDSPETAVNMAVEYFGRIAQEQE